MPGDAAAALVSAYAAGATTRELAEEYGVHESTIRTRLRAAGATMRARGVRESVDVEQIITLRRRHKLAWSAVAEAAGCSETAAKRAYLRATGDRGTQPPRTLTARQVDRLRQLYEACEPVRGNAREMSGQAGRRLLDQIRAHRDSGVTLVDCSRALGLNDQWAAVALRSYS